MQESNLPQNNPADAQADAIERLRPYLFSIAYRMVGSASEAEDIVQDALLRYLTSQTGVIESHRAYLSTIVTRLSLDHLKSARVTLEQYRGPWLPEPVLTADLSPGPDVEAERLDDISTAILLLLETLSPEERAAFVLREAFEFHYNDIGEILNKSSAACRKLVQRARAKLKDQQPRNQSAYADQRRLAEQFLEAAREGNVQGLAELLAEDVTIWADGGDEALAARKPVVGRGSISRYSVGLVSNVFPDATLTIEDINGQAGILMWSGGTLISATTLEVEADHIIRLYAVVNPRKLSHLQERLTPPETPIL